jgi:hypothetical protein
MQVCFECDAQVSDDGPGVWLGAERTPFCSFKCVDAYKERTRCAHCGRTDSRFPVRIVPVQLPAPAKTESAEPNDAA